MLKEVEKKNIKKVVLAYSGGLDTSIIIPWLKENYNCEVIAFAADLGQGEELEPLKEKAIKTGASKIYIEDLRKEFVSDFVFPAICANAIYESRYLLGTSLARPLIAKKQIEIAHKEKADAVAHGATGKGNDQVRFELTYMALDPKIKIIAPWKEWTITSREDAIDYAKEHNISIPVTKEKPYSMDKNLFHLSFEGGKLEEPWNQPDEDMFILTTSPENAPDKPEFVKIDFKNGRPTRINGRQLSPVELMQELNFLGGKHGIGRVDIVENRLVGIKSRGVYETPGGTILHVAHRDLESITIDRETTHFKEIISQKIAEMIYNGLWYSPLMAALQTFVNKTQERVNGTIRLKLYKGQCLVVGRKSPNSLYDINLATFGQDDLYNQKDAEGFIKLFGLPLKVEAMKREEDEKKSKIIKRGRTSLTPTKRLS
ncbi:MAG: argininosuccinate synthase [bacterium]